VTGAGNTGATGATGASGGAYTEFETVTGSAPETEENPAIGEQTGTSHAACPSGWALLSGGARVESTGESKPDAEGAIIDSRPEYEGEEERWEWRAVATVVKTGSGAVVITPYAYCAK
jgi:hypothetical protein